MNLRTALSRFRNSGIDPLHPMRSLARWPRWLVACAHGGLTTARFATGGLQMQLVPRLHSFGSTSIYIKRDAYEPELLAAGRLIEPGSVALDIGGSFGIFALFMAHFTGPRGKVHSFEPARLSFDILSRNVALNRLSDRIALHRVAAADRPSTLQLTHLSNSPVNFTVAPVAGAATEEVPAARVADLVPVADAARVGFVKIDVEGYEMAALEGARPILEARRPTILFEVSAAALARQGQAPADIFAYLASYGYRFWMLRDGRFQPQEQPSEGNVFAAIDDLSQR